MLPKKNRATTKEVEKIFKAGRFLNSLHLTFKYLKVPSKTIKISFIAPKSVAKLAVKRNLLRRCGYSALQKCMNLSPAGLIGVFIFKKPEENISTLEHEIKSIFSKSR